MLGWFVFGRLRGAIAAFSLATVPSTYFEFLLLSTEFGFASLLRLREKSGV